jgi:hypothetical protein
MSDTLPYRFRNAFPLVSHHYDAVVSEFVLVDILAIEQRSIDRYVGTDSLVE